MGSEIAGVVNARSCKNAVERLRINKPVIVEGKYDKIRLETVLDAFIIPTNGFGIFKDRELREFICALAMKNGIVALMDSDTAGFKIRAYLKGMIPSGRITNVYIPDIFGKEKRKKHPSAEGKLGVEGIDTHTLRHAFALAGILPADEKQNETVEIEPITRLDLYEDGFTGGENSRMLRLKLYKRLSFPARLNISAVLPLLNGMMTRDEYKALAMEITAENHLIE